MRRRRILIINPNSDRRTTASIDRRLEALRQDGGPDLVCMTLEEGPIAIETAEHCRQVIGPLCDLLRREDNADAYVVGCFSDPGLSELRMLTDKPVLGFCEAGVTAALMLSGRYGILTNLEEDIPDELAYLRAAGLDGRLTAIEPVGIPVEKLADHPETLDRMIRATDRLAARGAGSVVLGCAGFSAFASRLQEKAGIVVVDPTIASVSIAMTELASRRA